MTKPKIAITMGDQAGVGPEVIVGSWSNPSLLDSTERFVIGRTAIIERAVRLLNSDLQVVAISDPGKVPDPREYIGVLPIGSTEMDSVEPATVSPVAGKAAYDALKLATELAIAKTVDAIVTAPLNKESLQLAGHDFPGHTELLAHWCESDRFAMMLYIAASPHLKNELGLGVIHTTLHTSLRNAIEQLNESEILDKCQLAVEFVRSLISARKMDRPERVAVAALNPHAGENGIFGDEEKTLINPAVQNGIRQGWNLTGPAPVDTLMHRAAAGDFDAVVAMYHDQGHIALKLLGLHQAVNVTLGLPIIRTSVAHGTAFDIAWQGIVDSRSMVEATRLATVLCN